MIRLIEQVLSDGSISWGVTVDHDTDRAVEIDCVDHDAAHNLANALEAAIPGGQYDGWAPLRRAA